MLVFIRSVKKKGIRSNEANSARVVTRCEGFWFDGSMGLCSDIYVESFHLPVDDVDWRPAEEVG